MSPTRTFSNKIFQQPITILHHGPDPQKMQQSLTMPSIAMLPSWSQLEGCQWYASYYRSDSDHHWIVMYCLFGADLT